MLALTFMQGLVAFLFCTTCVLLILLVLIQKGKGGGLSGAFGGVGSYSPFGTKTGDALTWATVVLTAFYLLIAVLANYAWRMQDPVIGGTQVTAPQDASGVQPIEAGDAAATQSTAAPAVDALPVDAPTDATEPVAPGVQPVPPAAAPAVAPNVTPVAPATQPGAGQ